MKRATGTVGVLVLVAALATAARADENPPHDASQDLWQPAEGLAQRGTPTGRRAARSAKRLRTLTLDHRAMADFMAGAPRERGRGPRPRPLVLSVPAPDGGFQRFEVQESQIMEPGLAAKHPEIKTYSGRGIDSPASTIRFDLTPLGFSASVRGPQGRWFVDPAAAQDTSVYRSYFGRDVVDNPHGPLVELASTAPEIFTDRGYYHPPATVTLSGAGFAPLAPVVVTVSIADSSFGPRTVDAVADAKGSFEVGFVADPDGNLGTHFVEATDATGSAAGAYDVVTDEDTSVDPPVGDFLRTYRLALLSDPTYAAYFGAENVTAAKVSLINRVTHIYEAETSIRLTLVANNDVLNLNTAAQMTGANGPCGGAPCFSVAQASGCPGANTRSRVVMGLLVGASNYDIGHIVLGVGNVGVSTLGVVGGTNKAMGCTGLTTPVGDLFAVDYVAHEMGHQFGASHTFNAAQSCGAGARSAGNSIEPGSGSSIMASAGTCQTDDLQPHADPYWSMRSFDDITNFVATPEGMIGRINEVQMITLTGFDGTDSFQLLFNGNTSAPIVRGTNVNVTGTAVRNALLALGGWTLGSVTVAPATDGQSFSVTFGGSLMGTDISPVELVNCTGCSGFVGEIARGGVPVRVGTVTATGKSFPTVTTAPQFTIPVRTPFALTGSAEDADGDAITYMWEQNDRGGPVGTALLSNTKTNGPLFRQFGTAARVSDADAQSYDAPGANAVSTDPTRVFPDLSQILANNTNAETGTCPAGDVECFSEFLPTSAYVGVPGWNASPPSLHFRLTARVARPGGGAVNNAMTTLILAPTAGPFLVTAPNAAAVYPGGSTQTVTWNVANTDAPPVNTADVRISLSVDGGLTYPHELAAVTPNDGSEEVLLPNLAATRARVKIEAVGNVFFDVSNADFTIQGLPLVVHDAPAGGAVVQYSDSLAPTVTVFARDDDSPGEALVASAFGLPTGLALAAAGISDHATRPGTAMWAVAGQVTAAPGTYDVTVTVTDDTGGTGVTTFTILVTQENAEAVYTGDTLAFTHGSSSVATVLLRATVRDSSVAPASGDTEPGDVTNAMVSFKEGASTLCGPRPITRLEGATSGTASCLVPLWAGTHSIDVVVDGYYVGSAATVVEVAEPEDSEVKGAGYLLAVGSGGTFPATVGTRVGFVLDVKYDVKRKDRDDDDDDDDDDDERGAGRKQRNESQHPKGSVVVLFRSGGKSYAIKSTVIESLGVARTTEAGGACPGRRHERCLGLADVRATASLYDVSDARRPVSLAGNLSLQVTVTDKGGRGRGDSIGLTLWSGDTLLFSSNWTGSRTLEQTLAAGQATVR